jgi:hypothetical protein
MEHWTQLTLRSTAPLSIVPLYKKALPKRAFVSLPMDHSRFTVPVRLNICALTPVFPSVDPGFSFLR